MKKLKEVTDKKKTSFLKSIDEKLTEAARELGYSLEQRTVKMKQRDKKVRFLNLLIAGYFAILIGFFPLPWLLPTCPLSLSFHLLPHPKASRMPPSGLPPWLCDRHLDCHEDCTGAGLGWSVGCYRSSYVLCCYWGCLTHASISHAFNLVLPVTHLIELTEGSFACNLLKFLFLMGKVIG